MFPVYSSTQLSADERFIGWQQAVDSTYGPNESRLLDDTGFDGELSVAKLGDIQVTSISSSPVGYERRAGGDGESVFFLSTTYCKEAYVEQDGRLSRQGAGDLVFYDGSRPYRCWFPHGDRQLVLTIPRTKLIARLPQADLLVSRTLGQDSALGKLANAMMREACDMPALPATQGACVGDAMLDVLTTAFSMSFGQADDTAPHTDSEQFKRVKRYLAEHLHDSELNVQSTALAMHLSARTLNRMFARTGTTFGRWLWDCRLGESRRGLMQGKYRSVTDAALSCGFTNLSHFSRAFRHAFGMSPSQLLHAK